MWIRLVAIANLFGRHMRGQPPHTAMALGFHVSAGGRSLPSDEAFRAALGNFNSADPANSPLARVLNSDPAADDLKGKFRKLAYGSEATRGGVAAVRSLIAEYPEALYTVPNRMRATHYNTLHDRPAGIQAMFRDRYFFSDPDPRVLSLTLSRIRDVLTEYVAYPPDRLGVWQLLQANLNRLNNHPSPEVRSATSDLIMHVALHAQDSEVAVAAKSLLSVRQRIVFVDAIGIGDFLRSSGPGLTIVGKVVHYVVCAPGLIVGGLFGLIGGFFKGIFTGRNPFETAINMAIDSAFVGSMLIIAAVAATIGVVGFIALVAAAVPAVALPLMLMLPLLIIENQNLVPSFLRPGRGGSNGGTLGTIVTGFPAGIVCGVAGAVLGGIGGFIVGLFQGHPLRGAAIGAGKLATIGMVWGGFIGGGFIGYTVGSLIGLAAGEGQK